MPRVKFLKGKQSDFLNRIRLEHKVGWPEVAEACGVHTRTLFDWRRDKYQMDSAALQSLGRDMGYLFRR